MCYTMDIKGRESIKQHKENLWHFLTTRNNLLNTNVRLFAKNCSVKRKLDDVEKCPSGKSNVEYTSNVHLNEPDNKSRKRACLFRSNVSVDREENKNESWKLAPNRYDTLKEPFANKKGKKGAFISKHTKPKQRHYNKLLNEVSTDITSFKMKQNELVPNSTLCSSLESFKPLYKRISALIADTNFNAAHAKKASTAVKEVTSNCNQYKSAFLKGKRFDRPSSRLMTHSINGCYRDPNEPGPAEYTITNINKQFNLPPMRNRNQFKFYPKSNVPEREENMKKNPNSNPGPGRYEARFMKLCPGKRGQIYEPDLELLLQKENRMEFREIPYTHLKRHKYYSPNWNHVQGRGFPHLFKTKSKSKEKRIKGKKVKDEQIFKSYVKKEMYLRMVNHPKRIPLSICHPYKTKINVNFTRIVKTIRRRPLRVYTNVAFGKCFAGFFAENPKVHPIKDQPIMTKSIHEITTKYGEVPKRLRPVKVHEFHRKSFAFVPVPGEKLLIDGFNEIQQEIKSSPERFYFEPVQLETFLDVNIPATTKRTLIELNEMEKKHLFLLPRRPFKQMEEGKLKSFSGSIPEYLP